MFPHPSQQLVFHWLSLAGERHSSLLASLSSRSCKRACRWGSALRFLSPRGSRAGHPLEICTHSKCFILPSPSSPLKHTASAFHPKLQRGSSSEWASEEQCRKRIFGAHIQAETQLNESSTWCQTKRRNFRKTLVHYLEQNFQQGSQKAHGETGGLSSVWVATSLGLCPLNCSCKYATCVSERQIKDANSFVKEKVRENLLIAIFSRFMPVSVLNIYE